MTESLRTPNEPLLGAHMQTTGGIHRALLDGAAIGCGAVQLFTTSPQQWKARPLTEEAVQLFDAARRETKLFPLVVHDSYLINLASGDEEMRGKSQKAFMDELERCERLGIQYLVTHCGAHQKDTEAEGLERLADSLSLIHRALLGYRVQITLEVTAGQGTCLGHQFEHLARVLDRCAEGDRLRICLDTCHAFAAGYDIRTAESYEAVMESFDRTIGLHRLAVIHANDSKRELGSRVDRHDHIGRGAIGLEAFRLILRDPRLKAIPKIVETPDFALHAENIRVLRALAALESPVTESVKEDLLGISKQDPAIPPTIKVKHAATGVAGTETITT